MLFIDKKYKTKLVISTRVERRYNSLFSATSHELA